MKKGHFSISSTIQQYKSVNNFILGTCFPSMLKSMQNSASFAVKDTGKLLSQIKYTKYASVTMLVYLAANRLSIETFQTSITKFLLMDILCSSTWQPKSNLNYNFKQQINPRLSIFTA